MATANVIPDKPDANKPSDKYIGGSGSKQEHAGLEIFNGIFDYILKHDGQFLRDEDEGYHLVMGGKRIPLKYAEDNYALGKLVQESTGKTLILTPTRIAVQRLNIRAMDECSKMALRRFSGMSEDLSRLYVPVDGGGLLRIDKNGPKGSPNGTNPDSLWVEHPFGQPLKYKPGVDVKATLATFERLCVETQACEVPAMKWLVAMNLGLFPFVREVCVARFIQENLGSTQNGKTTGAQRFTLLHGLGDVNGNVTPAWIDDVGDVGLLVADNKEQANFNQPLIDCFLYLATGARKGRSSPTGATRTSGAQRPVAVFTTIQGAFKTELLMRIVAVSYRLTGQAVDREQTEATIKQERHAILSAFVMVLVRWFQVREENNETPNPRPNFGTHFRTLADLLRAYADVMERPRAWAEDLIRKWAEAIVAEAEQCDGDDEEELTVPLMQIFQQANSESGLEGVRSEPYQIEGLPGRLFSTTAAVLLAHLKRVSNGPERYSLPKNSIALGRTLKSAKFKAFTYLPQEPKNGTREMWFFVPDR